MAIKSEATSDKPLDGDTVVQWEQYKDIPRSQEILTALTEILIDENDKIPQEDKEAARREFAGAYVDAKAFLSKTNGHTARSKTFGDLTNTYRRRLALVEDQLASHILQRLK